MKSAAKRRSHQAAPGRAGIWEVLVVDSKPLRKKAQREYQKAVRDLAAAKAESERFYNEDQPLYTKWLNSNFGALLTEIRDLQHKLVEVHAIVHEVHEEQFFGGHRTMADAYKEVLRRREQPEEAPAEPPGDDPDEASREFEDAFGEKTDEYWARFHEKARNVEPGRISTKPQSGRLKELYRQLARRLHPDKGAAVSAKEKEWWHQTQAAYEEGSIDKLEMILTLVEVEDKGTRESTISVLKKLTAEFKKTLRTLKRQLAQMRGESAWKFSQRTDRAGLFRATELGLRMQREKILFMLRHYNEQVERWSKPRQRPRARTKQPQRQAWTDEEWF